MESLRSTAGVQALADLLASMAERQPKREQIRTAVRPVCEQARQDQLDAIDLVKLVKQLYAGTGNARAAAHAPERQQTLERIISVCIDEYYASG